MKRGKAERLDDQRVLAGQAILHLLAPCMQKEHPRLGITQSFDKLVFLEALLLDAGMVALDAEDRLCSFLDGQKASFQWTVWKQYPDCRAKKDSDEPGDQKEPVTRCC